DGHVVTQDQRIFVAHDVQHAAVLDIRARAYAHVMHVATNHRARPDAAVFADGHVANDDGRRIDVGGRGDPRALAAIWPDVRLALQEGPLPFGYLIVEARYTVPAQENPESTSR